MAQPPAYNRVKDFGADYADQTDNQAINTELDAVSASVNGIRANLALIQRDDGGLRDGIVTKDSLSSSLKDDLYAEFSGNINDSVLEAQQAAVEATNAAAAANADAATAVSARNDAQAAATSAQASAAAASASQSAASGSATAAQASATAAASSASNAAGSATTATTAAGNASSSAGAAAASASSASTSASTATNAENDAQTSAIAAAGSASSAAGSASLAQDWAAKMGGPVAGGDYSAKYYAQQAMAGAGLPKYNAGNEPTVDSGDIWINGIGACRWDAGDSRYWLIPTYTNTILITSSGTLARPNAYVKYGQWDGCGGGGSGGRGSTVGSGRSSGGGGGASISREPFTFSSTPLAVTIGAGGAGPSGAASPVAGNDGGATVFNGVTLGGGKAGTASNTLNVEGGVGGTSASPRTVAGEPGDYANTSTLLSAGGATAFGYGLGGRNGAPNTVGTANPSGYGAGSGGVGGSNSNPAAPGFIRIWY